MIRRVKMSSGNSIVKAVVLKNRITDTYKLLHDPDSTSYGRVNNYLEVLIKKARFRAVINRRNLDSHNVSERRIKVSTMVQSAFIRRHIIE